MTQTMSQSGWDIFCKIVDNYGDIGVCWRLAKQLANEHPQLKIRLYIDDIIVASKIIPTLNTAQPFLQQTIDHVEIYAIEAANSINETTVIIETFSCGLPALYVQSIEAALPAQPVWLNVEYLSAEPWVDDFHGKPSKLPSVSNSSLSVTKYYFFPGFSVHSGGLLREKKWLKSHKAFEESLTKTHKQKMLAALLQQVMPTNTGLISLQPNTLNLSLFCYPQADIASLIKALQLQQNPVNIFVPFNENLTAFNKFFADFNYQIGEVYQNTNITFIVLPFLSQTDYDTLLQSSDLNFVRGEDSWIRAIWAGNPFIWQPYIQTDHTHIQKLNAFLQTHFCNAPQPLQACISNAHLAWSVALATNTEDNADGIWHSLLNALPNLQTEYAARTQQLMQQIDLATALVRFSEKVIKNQV